MRLRAPANSGVASCQIRRGRDPNEVCKGGRDLYRASGEPSTVAAADDAGARQLAPKPLSRWRATLGPHQGASPAARSSSLGDNCVPKYPQSLA
jgi:hypothetical protein